MPNAKPNIFKREITRALGFFKVIAGDERLLYTLHLPPHYDFTQFESEEKAGSLSCRDVNRN